MGLATSLPFIAFVVWLLAVPMEGVLLAPLGVENALVFFLVPHVATLAVIGTVLCRYSIRPFAAVGGATAMGATVLLPNAPAAAPWLLACAGVGSAFLCVRAGSRLRRAPSGTAAAAAALVGANLLLFVFTVIPLADSVKFYLSAAFLMLPLLAGSDAPGERDGENSLLSFLPFVFVFQMVSGLMYGTLYGQYARVAVLPGIELVFYAVAVGGGLVVLRRRREGLLAMAIVAAMFAFSLYLLPGSAAVGPAMFAMQGAAGFLDLYLLVLLLAQRNTLRAFGLGLAVACAGIAAGKGISVAIGDASQLVAAAANLVLTTAVLLLYLVMRGGRRHACSQLPVEHSPPVEVPLSVEADAGVIERSAAPGKSPQSPVPFSLPAGLRKRFSEQEKSVLGCIVQGMTFRETARELVISESSVKTYMKRIYDKMSVSGKDELLAKLGEEQRS